MSQDNEDSLTYTLTTVPANSQYILVWDTTMMASAFPASAAAAPVPGVDRRRWAHFRRLLVTIKTGAGDSVSVVFQKMSDPTLTTASAFETDASGPGTAGVATHTASSTTTYNWLLPTPDSRVYVEAGANNPASMITTVIAHTDASAGV
jgi:hypothetical protein